MEIGDWKATSELNQVYKKARELGLETNIAELEAFGFTIVEPGKVAPAQFAERVLEVTLKLADEEDPGAVKLSGESENVKPAYGRQLFHLLTKDPCFTEMIINPAALTLASYMAGASCRLYSTVAFIKEGNANPTVLHCDSTGMPPPLPYFGNLVNVCWILTDYTVEKGTLFFVPGSHRYCRHPNKSDLPKFMGGSGDDDCGSPVIARSGSLLIFHGNLWHGTYPKTSEATRIHLSITYCRNYINPAENFDDVSDEMILNAGERFARLIGRDAWQGYHSEGSDINRMAAVRSAQMHPSA